ALSTLGPFARRFFPRFPLPRRRFMSPLPAVRDDVKSYANVGFRAMPKDIGAHARMSAQGQKRTCAAQEGMSALPPKADMCSAVADVRYGPIADILVSFDHFVGNLLKLPRNLKAERLRSLEIDR